MCVLFLSALWVGWAVLGWAGWAGTGRSRMVSLTYLEVGLVLAGVMAT